MFSKCLVMTKLLATRFLVEIFFSPLFIWALDDFNVEVLSNIGPSLSLSLSSLLVTPVV